MPVTINRPLGKVGDNLKKPEVVSKEFNPMLAAEGVLGKIKYPAVILHKHNGVRGLNQQGQLVARSLKPIPNKHTRSLYSHKALTNFDGELVVGDPFDEEVFATSTSGVMTVTGAPDVNWFLFDFTTRLPLLLIACTCWPMQPQRLGVKGTSALSAFRGR